MSKAKKRNHFLPWWVGDYLADTSHLTTEQHGAYLLLLAHEWRTGPLPLDPAQLAQIVRMAPGAWRRRCEATVMRFFTRTEGGWVQSRLEAERAEVEELSEKRAENGRRGAIITNRKRDPQSAENTTNPIPGDAAGPPANGAANERHPYPQESNSSLRSESDSPQRAMPLLRVVEPKPDHGAEFQEWYAAYPRKEGRKDAMAAYVKARKGGMSASALLSALAAYRWPDERRFYPHPATWLNGRRWEDEPATETLNTPGGRHGQGPDPRRRAGAGDDPATFEGVLAAFADVAGRVAGG